MTDPWPKSGTDGPKAPTEAAHVAASRQRAILPASGHVSMGRGEQGSQVPGTMAMPPLEVDPRGWNGPTFALGGQASRPLPSSQQPAPSTLPSFGEPWEQTPPYASNVNSETWLHSRSWNHLPSPNVWGNSEPLPYDRASQAWAGHWQAQDPAHSLACAPGDQNWRLMQQTPEYKALPSQQRPVDLVLEIDAYSKPDHLSPLRDVTGDSVDEQGSIEIDGRKYQSFKEGAYILPNDPEEQDRLDLQHAVNLALLDGRLATAPVQTPARTLDLMTGTGIWAVQYAQQNPRCEVMGTDLALIQPLEHQRPANVSFVREDAEGMWTLADDFDYIHMRLGLAFTKDHAGLVEKMFTHLRPGGWVEIQDGRPEILSFDGSHVGAAMTRWAAATAEGLRRLNLDPEVVTKCAGFLRAAGFVDVHESILPVPIGGWALDAKYKRVGRFNGANLRQAWASGTGNLLLKAAGMHPDNVQLLNDQCVAELDSGAVHCYGPAHIIHARKPLDAWSRGFSQGKGGDV